MPQSKPVVGICSIGSGVGQSVINSCNATDLPITTLGLGNNPLAFGQYECNDYDYIPSFYEKNYIEKLLETCEEKKIKLLIPGHDDEAQLLAANEIKFKKSGIKVLVSNFELVNICRSKDKLGYFFSEASDLFVKSYSYEEIIEGAKKNKELSFPIIAKPKNGYASKNIHIIDSIQDIKKLGNHLIYQEIAIPEKSDPAYHTYINNLNKGTNSQIGELSIQLVADKKGKIQGIFSSYNKLNNGIPIEILPYQSSKLDKALDRLIPLIQEKGLKGPINLQGRMTDQGLKIFEINPRFTGITGLRAKFGFNEVAACIKHWLFNEPMQIISYNRNCIGIRQTADKVINATSDKKIKNIYEEITKSKTNNKTILITGSTGALGSALIKLLKNNSTRLYTLDRSPEQAIKMHGDSIIQALSWDDIENDRFNLGLIDTVCHLASARPFHSSEKINESLLKTYHLFYKSSISGVGEIIYASSQSVYGINNSTPCNESMPPRPETIYAASKLSGEQLLEVIGKNNPTLKYISLRLSALIGSSSKNQKNEAVNAIINKYKNGDIINIFDGSQILSRMHYEDAGKSIKRIIEDGIKQSGPVNISSDNRETLSEIIDIIKKTAKTKKNPLVKIHKGKKRDSHFIDNSLYKLLYPTTEPYKKTEDIIKEIYMDLENEDSNMH